MRFIWKYKCNNIQYYVVLYVSFVLCCIPDLYLNILQQYKYVLQYGIHVIFQVEKLNSLFMAPFTNMFGCLSRYHDFNGYIVINNRLSQIRSNYTIICGIYIYVNLRLNLMYKECRDYFGLIMFHEPLADVYHFVRKISLIVLET